MKRAALATFALALSVRAAVVDYWWDIGYVQANPDGQFERRVVGVNGTWPPPPISVTRGDTLRVHAHNGLDVPTSLHHHGMFFNRTGYYDGAVGVTQCGIPPGQDFTYEIPITDQWGTYWWHSHYSGQYVDGLRAPLLIHNTPETHAYDEEFTVILGDWYHDQHSDLVGQFLSKANPTGAEPVPDSSLIYFAQNGTYLKGSNGEAVGFNSNASLPFVPGRTYRLRVINTSAFAMFYFYIDGHQLTVIEVDGTDVQESPADFLTITTAQRYSVLVTARNDTSRNWLVHANMDGDMFDTIPDGLPLNITSSITYSATSPIAPEALLPEYADFNDTALVPVIVEAQAPADVTINLAVTFDTMTNGVNRAMFNNITYNFQSTPSMFSMLSMGQQATDLNIYAQTNPFVLQHGANIELNIINYDAGKHPFHLHGHKFQIVGKSHDVTSDDAAINPPLQEGQVNPIRRDTVQIPSGGSATLRFRADNPGTWLFHCHIDWHLSAGLAATFLEAHELAQQVVQPPAFMTDQCRALGISAVGNAAGKNSTTDLKGASYGPYMQSLGWHPRGIGALAGTIIAALLGMLTVCWYSFGGQLDEEEMAEEVQNEAAAKEAAGSKAKRMVTALRSRITH